MDKLKKPKASTKKREYKTDPKKKIEAGKPWTMHFDVDPEVALKLIAEKEKSPTGTQFQYLVNKALRKGYGLKASK